MEDFIVTSRAPIVVLNLPSTQETSLILDNFDMYREVCTGMMRDALNFAYLEHLMRISTSETETSEALRQFPRTLQVKLAEILELKKDLAQELIHVLESKITKEDIKLVRVNMIHISYKWDGRRLAIEEFEEGYGRLLPVCYTLTIKNRYYILYTPNMSYIDGYEAFDGSVKINYIPESTLPQLTAEFYKSPSNKAIQTEEVKKKKKEEVKNSDIESKKSFRVKTPEGFREEKIERNEMVIEKVEEENQEEENQDDEELEDDYEEEYSDESEVPVKKNRVKLEKTWEKYQKKAVYQRREDNFNPCDCGIF